MARGYIGPQILVPCIFGPQIFGSVEIFGPIPGTRKFGYQIVRSLVPGTKIPKRWISGPVVFGPVGFWSRGIHVRKTLVPWNITRGAVRIPPCFVFPPLLFNFPSPLILARPAAIPAAAGSPFPGRLKIQKPYKT